MKPLRKYLLSTFVATALSLTLANVTALAYCPEVEETEDYVCYFVWQDEYYCEYECYCKVEIPDCDAALRRGGYSIMQE